MASAYRYVLGEVRRHTDSVEIAFQGHEQFEFSLSKKWLREHGINPEDLIPGQHVLVQGKNGNTPADLWGVNTFENLVLVPRT